MPNEAWTDHENDLIVADYFAMLASEVSRQPYNKSRHRRALVPRLGARSEVAIERKHMNISAVLKGLGEAWIDGYKGVNSMCTPNLREYLRDKTIMMTVFREDDYREHDPADAAMLEEAEEVFSNLGVLFEVATRSTLLAQPQFDAIRTIAFYRLAETTLAQVLSAQEMLKDGPVALGEFARRLPSPHPQASTFALMVRRHIAIDIEHGLSDLSRVSLNSDLR
ncbi:hypothetical protein [Rubellimicrobium mesophilum]|uniref:hypothetical protein n=1 Tax=Rubellimicrobium mesophilum TaxID=1123067 RepID=UPI000561493F|nr:hypothetical protein [Rubellimicrobium mesophilum]